METFMIILLLLASGAISFFGILFWIKRGNTTAGRMIDPLAARGPRYRDGAVTYNQFEGMRYNVELEGPGGGQSARYQRRHPRRQHKQTRPWMK
jgi:hypothetical protein